MNSDKKDFGGGWSDDKLDALKDFLRSFRRSVCSFCRPVPRPKAQPPFLDPQRVDAGKRQRCTSH